MTAQPDLFEPPRKVSLSERRAEVYLTLLDKQWHTGAELSSATCGGSEGLRRLRELRANGMEIEKRKRAGTDQYEYRWTGRLTRFHL